jgi:predicted nucleic acid-binding Zn ribbon protein
MRDEGGNRMSEIVTTMAQQHAWGWTVGQISRWHGLPREEVEQLIAHGFPTETLPLCPNCNEPFVPVNGIRYCSAKCQKRMNNVRARERRRAEAAPIPCPTCGAEFRPDGAQRFCSQACKPQVQRLHERKRRACVECGVEFIPGRTDGGRGKYCSPACRTRSQQMTVARQPIAKRIKRETEQAKERRTMVVPSETYATKAGQYTETGFLAALEREKALLTQAGRPLIDTSMPACIEKAEREAAAQEVAA